MIPGVKEFVAEYVSDKAMGEDGYLAAKGLVPLPQAERDEDRQGRCQDLDAIDGAELS